VPLTTKCCLRGVLCFSTLNLINDLASSVSRRDALNVELASLAQKPITPPLWTGGQDRRHHSSHRELPPARCNLYRTNVDFVLPFIERGIRQDISVARTKSRGTSSKYGITSKA
jgi:hypothetical protein